MRRITISRAPRHPDIPNSGSGKSGKTGTNRGKGRCSPWLLFPRRYPRAQAFIRGGARGCLPVCDQAVCRELTCAGFCWTGFSTAERRWNARRTGNTDLCSALVVSCLGARTLFGCDPVDALACAANVVECWGGIELQALDSKVRVAKPPLRCRRSGYRRGRSAKRRRG